MAPAGAGSGTATFVVASASGYPPSSDLYVAIRQITPKEKSVAKTKHHESPQGEIHFNETFTHVCTADTQFRIEVKGHHTFGSDDDLGETPYFIDDTASGGDKEIRVGTGTVVIKSSFALAGGQSISDSPRSANTTSGLRRSFLSKKENRGSRDVTPA
jgi:hypothetical protein